MTEAEEKYQKRKVRGNYITTVISVSLVLFMIGLLGLIILHAKKLGDYVKENITLTVFVKDSIPESDIKKLKDEMEKMASVKSVEYIDKDQAAKRLRKDIGEDFISFLGYNPLNASLEVRLNADYANMENLVDFEKKLMNNPLVNEVYYQKSLVDFVNDNVKKIGVFILAFAGLLMLISLALINYSIRLAIYSQRFLIKTMQLVGATKSFIRWPFISKGILHGIFGGIIAILFLALTLFLVQRQAPEFRELQDMTMLGILAVAILVLGIAITWISTWMAVRKYLRIKSDDLYF